jgi:hypothetical protein
MSKLQIENNYLCRFSTSNAKELRQIINHLSHFCRDMTFVAHSGIGVFSHTTTENSNAGSLSVYVPDRDVSLTLVSMQQSFFNQGWFVHPSLLTPFETRQLPYHPCLNQYTCTALEQMMGKSKAMASVVNETTASAEVRIPVMCMDVQNCLRSAKDSDTVTLTIHWDDLTHYYLTVRQNATGIEVTHQKLLVKTQRVFLHKQIRGFDSAYLIKTEAFQSLLNALANVGQDDLFFIRNSTVGELSSSCLYAVGVWNTQATVLKLPYGFHSQRASDDDRDEWVVCGPFKLAPLIIFCNNRMCKHYILHMNGESCAIEGSILDPSNPSFQQSNSGPDARMVMLLTRMKVSTQRLQMLSSQVSSCLSREHYEHRGGPSILKAWQQFHETCLSETQQQLGHPLAEKKTKGKMGQWKTIVESSRWTFSTDDEDFETETQVVAKVNEDDDSALVFSDDEEDVQRSQEEEDDGVDENMDENGGGRDVDCQDDDEWDENENMWE